MNAFLQVASTECKNTNIVSVTAGWFYKHLLQVFAVILTDAK